MTRRLSAILLALVVGLLAATASPAQETPSRQAPAPAAEAAQPIDYPRWEVEAGRVERIIEAGSASTTFFENLRRTLMDWRARFLAERDADAARVASVQAQIDALGPPPAEGATEAAGIAERRAELNAQLARLQEPQLAAAAALTRAEGLIAEIDALLRERQQRQLLQLDPSPANPVNWPSAIAALRDIAVSQAGQFRQRLRDPSVRSELTNNAPGIVLLAFAGLLAIFRGRRWTTRLTDRLQARAHTRGRVAVAFLVSLLQITVPFVGVILLLSAAVATGFADPQAMQLLEALAVFAASVYVALWLAGRLFGDEAEGAFATLHANPAMLRAARQLVVSIGVAVGLATVLETISNFDSVPPAAHGVIKTPAYLLLGYLFWRAARLLRAGIPVSGTSEDGVTGFADRTLSVTARALVVIAIVGPALALVGYVNLTENIMVPAAQSLLVVGVLVALQPVIRDLYAFTFRSTPEEAAEALLPVLVNFVLVFAALPVFALLWGMRPDQLSDVYRRFWEGFTLGEARITPGGVFAIILVFAIGLIVTRLLQGTLRTSVLPRTKLDTGARTAVISGVGYVGIGLAAVIAITAGGIDLTALGVVVGALSVGIGFGLQNVVNNFVSGIILLIERPISEGDWIEVNGTMGIVKDISVRSTRIETFDRTDVIVPNADFISGTVTNWTRSNTIGRAVVTVGVAYGTDTRRVQQILFEIAREHPVVAAYPEPGVDFLGFGADSLDFRIRAILRDVNQLLTVTTEMHHRIAERFAEEGIEIPFALRDVWLRNPEALAQARAAGDDPDVVPFAEAEGPGTGDSPA